MLEKARRDLPQCKFFEADASTWQAKRPCDLILANALLQWIPRHEDLLPRLLSQLRPGGALAVQIPWNLDAPNHALMREVGRRGPWAHKMPERLPYAVKAPDWYYDLLAPLSSSVDMWVTEYQHVMEDHAAIVEWGKGTGLRPFLEPLSEEETKDFLNHYLEEIRKVYAVRADGKVLFPFRRLFFIAVKDEDE
jgi:trans-aconitate 2-methyltransferase